MEKTITFYFNCLSKGQYNALQDYIKEANNRNKTFLGLSFRTEGHSHFPYCSGMPSWEFYEDVRLTINPNNIPIGHKERKNLINESLKGLVDIISEFDWDFEIADEDSPPFKAIR